MQLFIRKGMQDTQPASPIRLDFLCAKLSGVP